MPWYRFGVLALAFMGLIAGCTAGRTAIGKGEMLEQQGRLDEAVLKYAEAAAANPNQGEYRLRFLKTSVDAARVHAKKGDEFLKNQNFDEALREYQSALTLDPSFDRVKQQSDLLIKLRNAQTLFLEGEKLEKDNKSRDALRAYQKAIAIDSGHKGAKEAIERLLKTRKTKLDGFELNLKSTKPITLKFKDAKIKEVFSIVTQLSGINFVFDDAVKDNNVSIYLENATFQQALDIITGINKLGKKALNESTVIIYPKNPEKIKQYEELFVQTFYLNKLDAKKAVNLIRTMLQVKKIYVNEEMNALVIRDTPDVLDVARKILEANDVPDAEVLLEVEVIEIAKKNADNFGLVLSRYAVSAAASASGSGALLSDVLTQPAATTTTTTTGTTATATGVSNLLNLFRWRGYDGFITVPNATFNFGKTIGNGETLSNPKIRVKNREKSKFNVGTRVPITTTSTNGTVGGVNVNVQYVDVGVKVSAEPTIQLNNEVNIKLSLEVSTIISKDKVGDGNTTVVTIGTRNLDTVLSLKDGETSIIGGLMQDIKSKSNQKVTLLGDIPVLGSLFSSHDTSNDKTELILAITPRIVRGVAIPDDDIVAFWSGMEDDPSTAKPYGSFVQEPDFAVPQQHSPVAAPKPVTPPVVPPTVSPAPAKPVQEPPVKAPVQAGQVKAPESPVAPVLQQQPVAQQPVTPQPVRTPAERISLNIGAPASVKVNDQFMAEIKVSDAKSLLNAPFVLVYDPAFLEFQAAAEGDFLKKDGKPSSFKTKVDKVTGQVTVIMGRQPESGGVEGSGTLLTASFKAKNKGPASLGFMSVKFSDVGGKIIDTIPYNTVIEVK